MRIAFFPYGTAQENPYQKLLKDALEREGVEVICIPGRKWFPLLQLPKVNADVIHFFWPHDLYIGKNTLTRLLKRCMLFTTSHLIAATPTVYSADNLASHNAGTAIPRYELKSIERIVNKCKGMIYMQSAAPAIFKNTFPSAPDKFLLIPHVHYLSVYPNTVTRVAARATLNIAPDAYVYLIAGRIEAYKGIEQVIEHFKKIARHQDILLIAGKCNDASYLETLRSLAGTARSILFDTQYIPDNRLQLYFNASDVLILNYKDMPLNPGSVILARTFGIPIIAPRVASMEALQKGDCILFDRHLNSGLEAAMIASRQVVRTYDKQEIAKRLQENEPSLIAKQLISFYASISPLHH